MEETVIITIEYPNPGGIRVKYRLGEDSDKDLISLIRRLGKEIVPMLCVQHGGSAACELSNKMYGLMCPKC